MIEAAEIYKVFLKYRGNAIVVPVGTSGRLWESYTNNENRDLNLGGSLGHTAAAALGVALALPDEKIVVFDAEGSLLQSTGLLATIAEQRPRNFYHFLMDNECYATTGGQPVPNAKNIDYAAVAKAMGYPAAYSFRELEPFSQQIEGILSQEGPVFIAIKIVPNIENEPVTERKGRRARRPIPSVKALWEELGMTS
jgi:thiamine pyrophosphate-dependent acetolactate synthase large subunit-like protein